ncbi:MAG: hypothetical protein IJJ31_00150, partial [Mogibacterium sp.]|nr:hypothetical protein [Mogibacterium sp.]
LITKEIPYNETGKVDVHRILKKDIKGQRFSIWPVRKDGELTGIRLEPYADMPGKQSVILFFITLVVSALYHRLRRLVDKH